MPYPPATPPGGYDPYGRRTQVEPSAPAPVRRPPGYPTRFVQPAPLPELAPPPPDKNGTGTGALICGIASILTCLVFFLGIPLGILGAVLGSRGLRFARQGRANNPGEARAGLVMGIIGMVLTGMFLLVAITSA